MLAEHVPERTLLLYQVRILNEALFASNLQVAIVVTARVDFKPFRESSFATITHTVGAG